VEILEAPWHEHDSAEAGNFFVQTLATRRRIAQGVPARMSADPKTDNTWTVLVVDDIEDNRVMYAEFLRFSGFRVVEAGNGVEAIKVAMARAPDLIVMDLSLPLMDGWEATRRLKSQEHTRHIPVIALTGHALDGHSEEARNAGCDAFLAKPCLPEALLETVQRILSGRGAVPRHDRAAGEFERESG
jgi:two-component system cell cycle response regulator DivK